MLVLLIKIIARAEHELMPSDYNVILFWWNWRGSKPLQVFYSKQIRTVQYKTIEINDSIGGTSWWCSSRPVCSVSWLLAMCSRAQGFWMSDPVDQCPTPPSTATLTESLRTYIQWSLSALPLHPHGEIDCYCCFSRHWSALSPST